MKNICLSVSLIVLISSCGNDTQQNPVNEINYIDSTSKQAIESKTAIGFDTTGLSNAPVKILLCNLTDKLIDTFDKDSDNLHHDGHFKRFVYIKLRYKNVFSKRIIGLKLKWFLVDSLGNPSDLKGCDDCSQGIGMGYTGSLTEYGLREDIMIDQTINNEWMQPCQSGVKILLVAPVEVEFYDKTKWNLGQNN